MHLHDADIGQCRLIRLSLDLLDLRHNPRRPFVVLALAVRFVVDPAIEGRDDLEIRDVPFMTGSIAAVLPLAIG